MDYLNEAVMDEEELKKLQGSKSAVQLKTIESILKVADNVSYEHNTVYVEFENLTFVIKPKTYLITVKMKGSKLMDPDRSKRWYYLNLTYQINGKEIDLGNVDLGKIPYYGDDEKLAKINKKIAKFKLKFL